MIVTFTERLLGFKEDYEKLENEVFQATLIIQSRLNLSHSLHKEFLRDFIPHLTEEVCYVLFHQSEKDLANEERLLLFIA